MARKKKGLPESEDSAEKRPVSLTDRTWIRRRWRKRRDEPVAHCVECDAHLNRSDTYYVRPAYTDGNVWLCAVCFDRLSDDAHIDRDHRYGFRRHEN